MLACLVLLLGPASRATAQDFGFLGQEFDARPLTTDEKRLLQLALEFEGFYSGLIDGAWGSRSQQAIDAYAAAKHREPRSSQWHAADLIVANVGQIVDNGWDFEYFSTLNVSFLVPKNALDDEVDTEEFINFAHRTSSLAYSLSLGDAAQVARLHGFAVQADSGAEPIYTVRQPDLVITRARDRDGRILYFRSDRQSNLWSSVLLSVSSKDANILAAVAASITPMRAAPLRFTEGGALDRTVQNYLAAMDALTSDENATLPDGANASDTPEGSGPDGSGTGFFVSSDGHVLTNNHVVDGCFRITVNGSPASIVRASPDQDLALVKLAKSPVSYATFADRPARLNSDVTVVGCPLAGVLGGMNVTRGSVSSLSGIGGDVTTMQITAPVQPGNSGGPVVDAAGRVVGVVVAKLDAKLAMENTGDIPQNVNFAIRGELATLFLGSAGVEPQIAGSAEPLPPEDLAESVAAYTAYIECSR
jgi:S1-C subfamily serine protease